MNSAATTQRKTEDKVKGKERIRGPKLAILVKGTPSLEGVPFVEGLRMAKEKGLVIASNKRLDKALVGSDEWKSISGVFACWSGTMTGYEKPGKKLGKSVVYTDPETKQRYVFPVPEDYKGTKNAILAVEHPTYILIPDGKDLVVDVKNIENVSLVENFPTSDGWYLTDEKHGIPTGDKVNFSNDDARHLWRADDGSRVGPVARGYGYDYYVRRDVGLDGWPSGSLGVAVEAPDANEQSSLRPLSDRQIDASICGPQNEVLSEGQSGGSASEIEVSRKLQISREAGKLIVEGTPEQLDAAIKLLKTIEK